MSLGSRAEEQGLAFGDEYAENRSGTVKHNLQTPKHAIAKS